MDSCHRIHNAAKKITKHFGAHLILLFINIYNDFKLSEDLREILKEICFQMNAKYISPKLYIATRWLLVFDVIENVIENIFHRLTLCIPYLIQIN